MRKFLLYARIDPNTFDLVLDLAKRDNNRWLKLNPAQIVMPNSLHKVSQNARFFAFIAEANKILHAAGETELTVEEIDWMEKHPDGIELLHDPLKDADTLLKLSGIDKTVIKQDNVLFSLNESLFKVIADNQKIEGPYALELLTATDDTIEEKTSFRKGERYYRIKHKGMNQEAILDNMNETYANQIQQNKS